MPHQSFLLVFANAGLVVQFVMLLLAVASVASWTIIFQRAMVLSKAEQQLQTFEEIVWANDLGKVYQKLQPREEELAGLENIFYTGFTEHQRLTSIGLSAPEVNTAIHRAMAMANTREANRLELHLPFLASVASVSPYLGLFGTVCGIMTTLQALGSAQQATIAMVAPGISETLIATAMGLFVAIPAVFAYNRYTHQVDRLAERYEHFQDELLSALQGR